MQEQSKIIIYYCLVWITIINHWSCRDPPKTTGALYNIFCYTLANNRWHPSHGSDNGWCLGKFSMIYLTIFVDHNNINHIGHSHFVLTWFGKCIYMSLTIRYFEKTHGWQKHIFSNNLEKQIQIWQNHVFPENFIYFPPVELKNWIIIYAGLRLSKSWHCIFCGHFGCNSCKLYGQRVWYQTCYLF